MEYTLWVLLPLMLLSGGILIGYGYSSLKQHGERILGFLYRRRPGIALLVLLWLLLTATALWYELFMAHVALYLMLFSLGRIGASLGLIFFAGLLVFTPVGAGWLVLDLGRRYRRTHPIGSS